MRIDEKFWTGLALVAAWISLSGALAMEGKSEFARNLTSLDFPEHRLTTDTDDVLSDYPDYLNFALEIGRHTDSRTASLLESKYNQLRRRSPEFTARFLRGLRFEMVQKIEFVGGTNAHITTQTPFMRRWVTKYLRDWLREADEYLYRNYATQIARINVKDE